MSHDTVESLLLEITELRKSRDLLIQAVHELTNPAVQQALGLGSRKRSAVGDIDGADCKKAFSRSVPLPGNGVEKGTQTGDHHHLPLEICDSVFRFLSRDDLDRCQLTCRSWNNLIRKRPTAFPKRTLSLLKLVCKNRTVQLSAASGSRRKEFTFPEEQLEEGTHIYSMMSRILQHGTAKRWVILNVMLNDEIVDRLHHCLSKINLDIVRVEMVALNLSRLSAHGFQAFIGQVVCASQYFIEAVRGARVEHFDRALLEQETVMKADDFTIYDVKTVNDVDMSLDLDDDVLLAHIFGNKEFPQRNSLYLDSPNVSAYFVRDILTRFVEEESLDSMVCHVEIAHCRDQVVLEMSREVTKEYEHAIQVEFSAKNRHTNKVVEVRMSRTLENDEFCHVTVNYFA